MVTLAYVNIWGHRAGIVMWNENTLSAVFEYDPAFERLGLDLSNISFLMDKNGIWRLSPAYDVSWSYNPKGMWTSQHQMSINNKWTDITMDDLLTVASAMSIKKPRVIIEKVIDVVAHWPDYANPLEIPSETVAIINSTLITQL